MDFRRTLSDDGRESGVIHRRVRVFAVKNMKCLLKCICERASSLELLEVPLCIQLLMVRSHSAEDPLPAKQNTSSLVPCMNDELSSRSCMALTLFGSHAVAGIHVITWL